MLYLVRDNLSCRTYYVIVVTDLFIRLEQNSDKSRINGLASATSVLF
jgi:hypothetical protein